jgi:hypothetical protein
VQGPYFKLTVLALIMPDTERKTLYNQTGVMLREIWLFQVRSRMSASFSSCYVCRYCTHLILEAFCVIIDRLENVAIDYE